MKINIIILNYRDNSCQGKTNELTIMKANCVEFITIKTDMKVSTSYTINGND